MRTRAACDRRDLRRVRGLLLCNAALALAGGAGAQDAGLLLGTIDVTAAPGTTTEDTGSWTTEWMRSATGLVLSQKETPQSTSVITDAQMKARDITSITEAMDAATGITVEQDESDRILYRSRGFLVDNFQFDGVPTRDLQQNGDVNLDMVLYDHVEIVRGATGLMTGAGEPGASINFIRKRPTSAVRREAAALVGDPWAVRGEIDLSGPLNDAGTVRGRIIGAAETREGWVDGYSKDKQIGFASVEIDLTDTTLLSAGISRIESQTDGQTWGGLPPYATDGIFIDWPRWSAITAPWAWTDTQRTEAFASLEQIFANGWTGRVTATWLSYDYQKEHFYMYDLPDPVTGLGMTTWPGRIDGTSEQASLNAVLNGDFDAFGRTHQFVLGAFGSKAKASDDRYTLLSPQPDLGNFWEWDGYVPPPVWSDDTYNVQTDRETQIGLYGTAQLRVTDALSLLAGTRVNWWRGERESYWAPETFEYDYSGILTPYLGLTYDVNETLTVYASATSIYEPQLVQDVDANYLDPTFGWNYEVGAKASLFDDRLYASAAVFQTEQKDVARWIGWDPATERDIYESIEGTTTRGFELEAAGAINDRWNVSLGYTYRYARDTDGEEVETAQPRNSLKAATDYRVPGVLGDRLTVGGAMRWQSKTWSEYAYGPYPDIVQDPYAVVDAMARYDLTDEVSLALNVTNVFDEKYLRGGYGYSQVVYGDGRGVELSLRARF